MEDTEDLKTIHTPRKKIKILSTGGTIAGSGKAGIAGSYKAGELPVSSILETIPAAADLADIEVIEICGIDSNDISFDHYARIKELAEKLDKDPDTDGIVITHGTDTLEESSFLLNLVLNVHKPVVLTGAMRPATSVSADGPMNLYQAIALACKEKAGDLGVLAVFSNSIYSGRDLEKSNSIKTDAFKTRDFGSLGYMQDHYVHLLQMPYGWHTSTSPFLDVDLKNIPNAEIFFVHQQADPKLLEYMLQNYDGVVLAGTGSGNYSKEIQDVIERYGDEKIIVRASRLPEGVVFDSEVFDPNKQTIPAYRIPPHKARLLLMLCLAKTIDLEKDIEARRNKIRAWFEEC